MWGEWLWGGVVVGGVGCGGVVVGGGVCGGGGSWGGCLWGWGLGAWSVSSFSHVSYCCIKLRLGALRLRGSGARSGVVRNGMTSRLQPLDMMWTILRSKTECDQYLVRGGRGLKPWSSGIKRFAGSRYLYARSQQKMQRRRLRTDWGSEDCGRSVGRDGI